MQEPAVKFMTWQTGDCSHKSPITKLDTPGPHKNAFSIPKQAIISISNLAIFTKVGIIDYNKKEIPFERSLQIPHNINYGVFFIPVLCYPSTSFICDICLLGRSSVAMV